MLAAHNILFRVHIDMMLARCGPRVQIFIALQALISSHLISSHCRLQNPVLRGCRLHAGSNKRLHSLPHAAVDTAQMGDYVKVRCQWMIIMVVSPT